MEKYSANGPSTSAGKNERAATMTMTESNTATNAGLSTFRVPAVSGINFLDANEPAIANGPIIGINLPKIIEIPHRIFQNGVLSPRPSKPEPLFDAADVN